MIIIRMRPQIFRKPSFTVFEIQLFKVRSLSVDCRRRRAYLCVRVNKPMARRALRVQCVSIQQSGATSVRVSVSREILRVRARTLPH